LLQVHLERLGDPWQQRTIEKSLANLPPKLTGTYDMILDKMLDENRTITEALTWLFHSERRMNVEELAVAAVFDLAVGLQGTCLVVPTDILHICGAFVEQDPATHVVRFAHACPRISAVKGLR